MAIESPHMGRFKAHEVVKVHVVTPRDQIQAAMMDAIGEITTALKDEGATPAGAWFGFHHRLPTDTFDFDVCFPVSQALATSGRLEHARIPEYDVARTAYHGPYEGLPDAWREFHRWMEHHGHRMTEQAIEQYSIGPNETPDPHAWQTDLMFVLAEGEVSKERVA